ncbi:MAG: hypothetical protein JOY80_12910 [Candidatus Dormibacteraeota bacterium]|nr:hypothetical protein [Candidatus Dormibacteraeota bacterium]
MNVQFHYIDSTTTNCADTTQNPPPGTATCGASWSSTNSVTPGPIPSTTVPDGAPLFLGLAGAVVLLGGVNILRRGEPRAGGADS